MHGVKRSLLRRAAFRLRFLLTPRRSFIDNRALAVEYLEAQRLRLLQECHADNVGAGMLISVLLTFAQRCSSQRNNDQLLDESDDVKQPHSPSSIISNAIDLTLVTLRR